MKVKALIVGNSNYPNDPLNNAGNDAADISDIFSRLSYNITSILDSTHIELDNAITEFGNSIADLDAAIFYFAGHGIQIGSENYLVSIDSNLKDESHAKYTTLPLNLILDYMNKNGARTNIIILDACREPLKLGWYRSVSHGNLATVFAPQGTMIAFATSPGQKAKDGSERNGLYTSALLQHIVEPHIPVEELFKRVRGTVFSYSNGTQVSWEHTSLIGTFCFNNGQLGYKTDNPYAENVVKDALYSNILATDFDSIIDRLKSNNYYTQNPAIAKFTNLDIRKLDPNQEFLFGRNVLQAAQGGSGKSIDFITNLGIKLKPYTKNGTNNILNGMLFEMYFNSYGSFRNKQIKDGFLNELLDEIEKPKYISSLNFIKNQLTPYQDFLCYVPGIHVNGISLDINLKQPNSNEGQFEVDSVILDGNNILLDFDDPFGLIDSYYRVVKPNEIISYIGKNIFVPNKKLKLTYNTSLSNKDVFLFPDNKIFSKVQEMDDSTALLDV